MTGRATFAFLIVLLAVVIASLYLSPLWSGAVTVDRSFGPTPGWWSPVHVLNLLDECALLLVAGAVLALLAPLPRPFLWGVALGAAFCGIRLVLSSNWFSDEATAFTYAWAYSEYIVPVAFGGLGAVVASSLLRTGAARAA